MSSSDGMTSCPQQPDSPIFCAKGCGFYGTASNKNMCSKCFKQFQKESSAEELKIPAKPQVPTLSSVLISDAVNVVTNSGLKKNRCWCCNKRVGLISYQCQCGSTFCSLHRYPEKHECSFDFKTVGRAAIEKTNPIVKADKLERI
ncbi:Zinc finger a20 and an1 domain-containing stress-associated protein [Thalictrum thalictroides]|uniref:Zinc finger a20 and an1 domain-containing stress-associated protein n=1 Tax=Thalictrum thalictroides TaxID=46969 RepID=A0A7J6XFV9_THATH|nr:Zinc finger a20 and an1 domain-containing stress-associated protein [Thalictrum thalictroides]